MKLQKLFEPTAIGTMELQNRIVMPAMGTNYADVSGYVTDRQIDYYITQAEGGPGLVITEVTCVDVVGKDPAHELCIYDDSYVVGLGRLAQAVKEQRVKCALQLGHAGRRASSRVTGRQPVAPSSIPSYGGEVPKELSIKEIHGIVEAFADAARRTRDAGFDAVEMHWTHGYLIAQFLSPLTNKRTDKYGGDLESRARFPIEIIQRVKDAAGKDFPLIIRISGDEYLKGGLTLKDTQIIARMFQDAGADAISVSAGCVASSEEGYIVQAGRASPPMSFAKGCYAHLAAGIKKVVHVPVICAGRISEPQLADTILLEGKADLVAIGRGLLADPGLPRKAMKGQSDNIRRCMACNECSATVMAGRELRCAVNAELGKGRDYRITLAKRAKNVLIAGGGPAGMEAARVAACRGHQVTLYEKKLHLGGNLLPASAASFKGEVRRLVNYLSAEIGKLGIKVELGKELTAQIVARTKPDVVIVATGSKPVIPAVPGSEKEIVTNAIDVLSGKFKVGRRPIIVGGGMVGCEVAAFLAEMGSKVTLVTRRNSDFAPTAGLAPDMEPSLRRWLLFELWPKIDIRVVANATYHRVIDEGLIVLDRDRNERLLEGDAIVFSIGLTPNKELALALKGKVPELHEIGDCLEPRKIVDAIHEGSHVARLI